MAAPNSSQEASHEAQDLKRFTTKKEAKQHTTKSIKRRNTLIKKADDFHNDCGYEVLLAIRKGHRSYIYTSTDTPDVMDDIMRKYLLPVVYTPGLVKEKKGRGRKDEVD
ncbi:uncharacterized protein F4807DRAFT_462455 [Annulohypoxylon truncatum]|uniref:uncharacterized protein n=1 Tax=Annulohypoxylon truncatum TaxID=327061 RepID=UPI00200805C6|nr:uncharacterized protein F4807DRAFT_462455 [Annulohypoxylon truncatum]KAI1207649.1 hypothetical protein F4807DRAFT_462455 [Annulohypoxylon truncatum]